MIVKEKIKVDSYRIAKLICNKCKREFKNDLEDTIEFQEFFVYNGCGGWGSVFGDSCPFELHLCQDCLKELVGKYIAYKDWDEL